MRFTEPGSRIRLRIAVVGRREEPARGQQSHRSLIIALRDHGTGIPADRQEAIFDRFVRVSPGDPSAGSGLGLSIVRAIAEGHGGRVHVDSREGVGSEFVLTLPHRPVPPVPGEPPPGDSRIETVSFPHPPEAPPAAPPEAPPAAPPYPPHDPPRRPS
jgi:signal transduction histidine kinase